MIRSNRQVCTETRFQYDHLVAGGVVDRAEWARVVQDLLAVEAQPALEGGKARVHGAKTRFATRVGIKTPRTVDTWLDKQVDVKESSVRAVAAAYGINPIELLIRVGFFTADEVPAPAIPAEDAWIVELVAGYDFSAAKKRQLTAVLLEQERRERGERLRRLREQIEVLGGKPTGDPEKK